MRIVTLEEHVIFPELTGSIPDDVKPKIGMAQSPMMARMADKLADIEGERLSSMDKSGISMQILSVVGLGADLLPADQAPAFARQYNEMLATRIAAHPDRFAAFAHLPMTAPVAAADELEYAVKTLHFKGAMINGLTKGNFLDHPAFEPILERAQELDVPIYLHPGLPPEPVFDAYYNGLPNNAGLTLSVAGWGWHSETAIHVLRMIVSGTFDRYPNLKLVIGHMGEMLPMMMARCDRAFPVGQVGVHKRSIIETLLAQVYITTSGLFTEPPLKLAIDTFGIDRILFSVDYPFSTNEQGAEYLKNLNLSQDQLEKIVFRNADKLFKINQPQAEQAP
jgi:predicted TIM-barrel fold metal-dependent hydrolase